MDKKQKLTYQKGIEQYLQQENVYDLFEDLLKTAKSSLWEHAGLQA